MVSTSPAARSHRFVHVMVCTCSTVARTGITVHRAGETPVTSVKVQFGGSVVTTSTPRAIRGPAVETFDTTTFHPVATPNLVATRSLPSAAVRSMRIVGRTAVNVIDADWPV